ncbi:MAG: signal peptidase I [Anaerovoracaceae bacterium]
MEENKFDFNEQSVQQEDSAFKSVGREIFGWIKTVIIVVVITMLLTRFVIISAKVPSGSMENTIMTGDRLIGARFLYWFDDPERGDIVLFQYPVDPDILYIKRCIGLPGETVELRNGKIYINGSETPLEEDYLKEEWTVKNDGLVFHVPDDCYLMLGDNRNNSSDSRYWAYEALMEGVASTDEEAEKYAYVKRSQIRAKAVFKYFKSFDVLLNDK